MATPHHKIAAWALLGILVVLGAVAVSFRSARDPFGVRPPVQNVSVQIDPAIITTGVTSTVSFVSVSEEGEPIDAWEGLVDGWLVRDDLTFVQHVTGEHGGATSTTQLGITPSEPGTYRMALIARADARVTTAGTSIRVRGTSRDLPPAEQSAAREGYKVTLSSIPDLGALRAGEQATFTYSVERTDTKVPLDTYRGSRGSAIAFREGGGLFVLGDPMPAELLPSDSATTFSLTFPEEGSYRVFFEFQSSGKRVIEARWVEVAPAG